MRKFAFVLLVLLAAGVSPAGASEMPPDTSCTFPTAQIPATQMPTPIQRKLFGVVEDSGQTDNCSLSMSRMELAGNAGNQAVRILVRWGPGVTYTDDRLEAVRNNVASIRAQGLEPFLLVTPDWNRRPNLHMPLRPHDRLQFMHYVTWWYSNLVDLGVTKVAIGLEPNSGHFWYPQCVAYGHSNAPHAYVRLLSMVYDDLHKQALEKQAEVTVIGFELSSHGEDSPGPHCKSRSPVNFLEQAGKALRRMHRNRPIMDWFSIHPYGLTNDEPPNRVHFGGTIGFADYPKLRRTLCQAFKGTHQSCQVPVLYSEWGVQTLTPASEGGAYNGKETVKVVSFAKQVEFTAEAVKLTLCTPGVVGFFRFLNVDEPSLGGWQSGAYFADETPKPSLPGLRQLVQNAQDGAISCSSR